MTFSVAFALLRGLSALAFLVISRVSSPLRFLSLDSSSSVCEPFAFFLPPFLTATLTVKVPPGAGVPATFSDPTFRSGAFLAAAAGAANAASAIAAPSHAEEILLTWRSLQGRPSPTRAPGVKPGSRELDDQPTSSSAGRRVS